MGSDQSPDAPTVVSGSHGDSKNQVPASGSDQSTGAPPAHPSRVGVSVILTEDWPLDGSGLSHPHREPVPDGLSANEIPARATGNQAGAANPPPAPPRPPTRGEASANLEGSEEWMSSSSSSECKVPGRTFPNTPNDYPAFTPEQLANQQRHDSAW
jgi:hypothetical protein